MKYIIIVFIYLSVTCQVKGQADESAMDSFIKFQAFINGKTTSADSAFYFAKKAATNAQFLSMMNGMMQMSFPRFFATHDEASKNDADYADFLKRLKPVHQELVAKMMADSAGPLHDLIVPMYYWAEVQEKSSDKAKLIESVDRYLSNGLAAKNLYGSRSLRYGLLIYRTIARQPDLQPLADRLLGSIKNKLESLQIGVSESLSYKDLEKRAHYRYLYAYTSFLESQTTKDRDGKEAKLKLAFDYSPDLLDKSHDEGYYYDVVFLDPGKERDSFQEEYLNLLTADGSNKEKTLDVLTTIALGAPERKKKLRAYYEANVQLGQSFGDYWKEAVNGIAQTAPPISLALLSGEKITSRQFAGQWVLVDFWGTWCAPCREEHPALQEFYESMTSRGHEKILVLTVACNDQRNKVEAYMEQKKYSFPVAMADGEIQKNYAVDSWPTKLLITPAGKYVTVPFHVDWVEFVKAYSGLL